MTMSILVMTMVCLAGVMLSLCGSRRAKVAACALVVAMGVLVASGTAANPLASAVAEEAESAPAPDFELVDQYGQTHSLADCEGKVVFLNFWTTWCPWCIKEMPDIEEVYHELGENTGDVLIFGVASPSLYDNEDEAGITAFLEENGWTYPVLMDKTNGLFDACAIEAFPSTWLIRADGTVMGHVDGAMSKEDMLDLIEQAINPPSA